MVTISLGNYNSQYKDPVIEMDDPKPRETMFWTWHISKLLMGRSSYRKAEVWTKHMSATGRPPQLLRRCVWVPTAGWFNDFRESMVSRRARYSFPILPSFTTALVTGVDTDKPGDCLQHCKSLLQDALVGKLTGEPWFPRKATVTIFHVYGW